MMDALLAAYKDVSEAVVQLRGVGANIAAPQWQDRAHNADAVRIARDLVASARSRLAALAPISSHQRARLNRIRDRLSPLPQGSIVEPFGAPELDGARNLEASQAARDRQSLEEVLRHMRELILSESSDLTLAAHIDAIDHERQTHVGVDWPLLKRSNPLVWIFLLSFVLIMARALFAR